MKIKITERVIVAGHPGVNPGDVVEVSAGDASVLIHLGKAVEFKAPTVEQEIQTREPEVEHRDPKTKPARSKAKLP